MKTNVDTNLATMPWIPVTHSDGAADTLSLTDVLTRAHELDDISPHDPLERSALLRFVTAWATLVVRQQKPSQRHGDLDVIVTNGFDRAAVNAVIGAHFDRLELIHPEHPIFQSHALAPAKVRAAARIHPSLPGDSTKAWMTNSNHDPEAALTPAQAALTALTFITHGLGNNGGPKHELGVVSEDGKPLTHTFRPAPSGPGSRIGTDVHFWWCGRNLAATLMMNIEERWLRETSLPHFLDPSAPTSPMGSLREWTHTYLVTLLEPAEREGQLVFAKARVGAQVDIPALGDGSTKDIDAFKEARKLQIDNATRNDPRRVWTLVTPEGKQQPVSVLFRDYQPENFPIQTLVSWWKKNPHKLNVGILEPTGETRLDVLSVSTTFAAGTTSLVDAAWSTVARQLLVGEDDTAIRILSELARDAGGAVEGLVSKASRSILENKSGEPLRSEVLRRYYSSTNSLIGELVAGAHKGVEIPDDLRRQWWREVLCAFDAATAPLYQNSTALRIATSRALIERRIAKPRKDAD